MTAAARGSHRTDTSPPAGVCHAGLWAHDTRWWGGSRLSDASCDGDGKLSPVSALWLASVGSGTSAPGFGYAHAARWARRCRSKQLVLTAAGMYGVSGSNFVKVDPPRLLLFRPVTALGGGGRGGGFTDVGELFSRIEVFLYTVADATVSVSPEVVQGGRANEATGD
ncbi:hypothetical protein E2562_039136 [Oryza meyeriana var. granulata]|uniref:Uncharacterized protein n=1 Tax=Oryza meyeriana var. granulata TaxID=110450 RepID=A0A6G1CYG6_9ORYZ|nr:hypothetical protein E2562_039136 [Oryza meyeriana var. granulata]